MRLFGSFYLLLWTFNLPIIDSEVYAIIFRYCSLVEIFCLPSKRACIAAQLPQRASNFETPLNRLAWLRSTVSQYVPTMSPLESLSSVLRHCPAFSLAERICLSTRVRRLFPTLSTSLSAHHHASPHERAMLRECEPFRRSRLPHHRCWIWIRTSDSGRVCETWCETRIGRCG